MRVDRRWSRRRGAGRQNGSAIFVVFILLLVLSTIAVSNGRVLRILKREIKLVEKEQLKKFAEPIVIEAEPPAAVESPEVEEDEPAGEEAPAEAAPVSEPDAEE